MSAHELASLYRQYKNETDPVASWLASTAKACGYPSDLLSTPPTAEDRTQLMPGRLKGKERKLAKKAAEEVQKSGALKSKSYIVALRDFIPPAIYIAGRRNPAVVVPDVFTTTISRVIDIRSIRHRRRGLSHSPPDHASGVRGYSTPWCCTESSQGGDGISEGGWECHHVDLI